MGGTESKPEKEIKKVLNLPDFLDVIATKYILTQNFEDLKNLARKEYCNKLIILTSKVIKKFFTDRDITYLAERIEDGIPYNRLTKENIIYLDTNSLEPSSQRFSKREQQAFKQEQDSHIKEQLFKQYKRKQATQKPQVGGDMGDYLKALLVSDKKAAPTRSETIRTPTLKKTLLAELDIRNPTQKDRMCKGIAKFYIKVAHLYAAIAKTINPRYQFKDSEGNIRNYSIWNKKKIPKGAIPHFIEDSLCSRRINSLTPRDSEGNITVTLSKVCKLNKRMKTLTEENYPGHLTEYGQKKIFVKVLGEEEGIPALEQLYNDKYDYVKGKFTSRIPGGKGEQQYKRDLQEFYEAFTPNNNPITYQQWNRNGKKKFSDIPLTAYHDSKLCSGNNATWTNTYEGRGGLFTDYANHMKEMLQNAQKNQKKLLSILEEIFVFVEAPNIEKTKIMTLNPKIKYTDLEKLVDTTRQTIVQLYIECQKDFQTGLNIFEGIVMERNIKNATNQNASLKRAGDEIIAMEPSSNLASNIQTTLKQTIDH